MNNNKETKRKRRIYLDIEADGLLDTVTRIWCIVAKDIDSGEVFLFHPKIRTACHKCSGIGNVTQIEVEGGFRTTSVYLCNSCDGSGEVYKGDHKEWEKEFKDFFSECDLFIGHNIIGYDAIVIEQILGLRIPVKKMRDTLVLSKLFRPVTPPNGIIAGSSRDPSDSNFADNRLGGHSLEAWGKRLGEPKQDFDDFSKYTDSMLAYCINDVELGTHIWDYLELERAGLKDPSYLQGLTKKPVPFGDLSICLEHSVAFYLKRQELNGFTLDIKRAEKLRDDTGELLKEMQKDLHVHFPPVNKFIKLWEPKLNKDGTLSKVSKRILENWITKPEYPDDKLLVDSNGTKYHKVYGLYEKQEFNPRSGQQIARRLKKLGWEPKVFTPTGQPKTDRETLQAAVKQLKDDHPEIEFLENYNLVAYNNDKATKWLSLVQKDGRVHGRINHMGAGTHRCTHSDDNMANVASVKHDNATGDVLKGLEGAYGYDCRACWTVPEGYVLVGADASGIQLRALAHYMNDPVYTKKLLEDDIHVVNQIAAGIKDRPTAKTFIYAWLLGAGDEKIGEIVGTEVSEYKELFKYAKNESKFGTTLDKYIVQSLKRVGRKPTKKVVATIIKGHKTKKQFLDRTPALKRLKTKDIPEVTRKGYLVGLDGRKLWIPSQHLAMSLYLQGFEAVVMKMAIVLYHQDLYKKKIPFKQVAFVHDEVQIECLPEHKDIVGQAVIRALKKAGTILKVNCELDGEYKTGPNWAETH